MPLCGENHTQLIDRLSRIEGQVRGLRRMVEEDRDCMEVLKQVAATGGAVRSVGMMILKDHLEGCVTEAIRDREQDGELIEQVIDLFNKFGR